MKKQAIDKKFAPKGYHAKAYTGCSDCAFYDEHAKKACGPDRKCLSDERPDKRRVIFVANAKRIRIPKVAYLLYDQVVYGTPQAQSVTMSKKVAEAWQAKHPCEFQSESWNGYKEIPVVSTIDAAMDVYLKRGKV
jgi:hypothetical protein